MSTSEAIGGQVDDNARVGRTIEILDTPYVIMSQDYPEVALRILAHALDHRDVSQRATAIGYVSTKPGRSTILGEFSGKPTGEVMPCNAVKGFVGEGVVYNKNVSTDQPFSGFRTAFAQRRAANTVKRHLK